MGEAKGDAEYAAPATTPAREELGKMHWPLVAIGQVCVIAGAMFCMFRDKKPLKLLAGATAGAAVTVVALVVTSLTSAASSRANWLEPVRHVLGLAAGFLGSTIFGALAGAVLVAFVAGPEQPRSSAYVGGLMGVAIAAVPVVFLQQTWPESVRAAVVTALLCQGVIAGALTGRAVGSKQHS